MEHSAYSNPNGIVDPEYVNGRTPDRGDANQDGTVPSKMVGPLLTTRMEQWNYLPSLRIDSGQVWPFVAIALRTTERQVIRLGRAVVLFGNDVINLKTPTVLVLPELAILTAIGSTDAYELLQRTVHDYSRGGGVFSKGDARL